MNDISVGAVGAAIIAGLVSLLGLIIGKEQKVSEFRQAWIDDLRKCLVDYLAHINSIADAVRLKKAGGKFDEAVLIADYKALNQANHGITLRVNSEEATSQRLLKAMSDFEELAKSNDTLTLRDIRQVEEQFLGASKDLLKFEWRRVKTGEKTYVIARYVTITATGLMLALLLVLCLTKKVPNPAVPSVSTIADATRPIGSQTTQITTNSLSCLAQPVAPTVRLGRASTKRKRSTQSDRCAAP